jgi:hypothetical protein
LAIVPLFALAKPWKEVLSLSEPNQKCLEKGHFSDNLNCARRIIYAEDLNNYLRKGKSGDQT